MDFDNKLKAKRPLNSNAKAPTSQEMDRGFPQRQGEGINDAMERQIREMGIQGRGTLPVENANQSQQISNEEYEKGDLKSTFQKRFDQLYPNKRLLGVQLDGFSHKIYADDGTGEGQVEVIRYIPQAPEQGHISPESTKFFEGHPNSKYQGNAQEIIYVRPDQRKVGVRKK